MEDYLATDINFLKGVGPNRALLLKKELNIHTFADLLDFYPIRYMDKSKCMPINQVYRGMQCMVQGKIVDVEEIGVGRSHRISAVLQDATGQIELVWFSGIRWIKNRILPNLYLSAYGKVNEFAGKYSISHPDIELIDAKSSTDHQFLHPIYSSTEKLKAKGLTPKSIANCTLNLLDCCLNAIPETLPDFLIAKYGMFSRKKAYQEIHFPKDELNLTKARQRLKFEELYFLQLQINKVRLENKKYKGFIFDKIGDYFNGYYHHELPFELTQAQKRVIKEIRRDMNTGCQMNRLLQGDVGSGKTMVALMSMLIACDNGYQCCLMAPTEILARQHYLSFKDSLKNMDIEVACLIGSTPSKEKKRIRECLENGKIKILIGTHALLEDQVIFKNLGLAVIDEQHRFGVAQRAKIWKKNQDYPPHILVMTATPIPRTLGMTLYGDLDVSVIDELPPLRKSVRTIHTLESDRERLFGFLRSEIKKGRQIYVVYPLIEESEKLDLSNLMQGFETLSYAFPSPEYAISILHGKMNAEDKEREMKRFVNGETQLMVSTTVIEVGVNVPNASVMVIENAERFGLSQLHQLRGRVGRGSEQSYCILMTADKLNPDSSFRIQTMVQTNDGFKIAEADLKLRGPGDLNGTQQSGLLDLKIADIVTDSEILYYARAEAIATLKEDPELQLEKNLPVRRELGNKKHENFWSKIS